MKSVLISIQPKWCELIASGKKTVEVRKTSPRLETPFKCYIYMTKGFASYPVTKNGAPMICHDNGGGHVIGEFVCDNIGKGTSQMGSCLTMQEIGDYANGGDVYGWHISDLVIYDKPKELREFYERCSPLLPCSGCDYLKYTQVNANEWDYDCTVQGLIPITRPPQSWRYVEGVTDDD